MPRHWIPPLLLLLLLLLAACNPNRPPSAELTVNPLLLRVQVSWLAADPEGDAFRCVLAFGDGESVSIDNCQGPQATAHTYAQAGSYTLRLRLTDVRGQTNEVSRTVTLPARPPGACPAPPTPTRVLSAPVVPEGVAFHPELATVPGRLLVRLPASGLGPASLAAAGVRVAARPLPGWAVIEVAPGREREEAERLVASGAAAYAQPVYRYRLLAAPNDPYFNGHQASQFEQMRLTEGWDLLRPGTCRPIVAAVDAGADLNHPDLAANLLPGYDFSDNDDDPSDTDGHGTLVAGVIGAVTNNHLGVAGSSDNLAYVLPVKVFPNATSDVLASAIRWATDAGAHVVNLSLCVTDNSGTHCADLRNNPDALIEDALSYAYDHGVIAVAASGNDGYSYVGYPASSPYTIAVGSVDAASNRSSFSNYGSNLDFVAPGENVTNTFLNDNYGTGSGTSFATPYLAGELALYLGQHYAVEGSLPSLNQARTCFENNTNQAARNDQTGFGIPQADRFLDVLDGSCYP